MPNEKKISPVKKSALCIIAISGVLFSLFFTGFSLYGYYTIKIPSVISYTSIAVFSLAPNKVIKIITSIISTLFGILCFLISLQHVVGLPMIMFGVMMIVNNPKVKLPIYFLQLISGGIGVVCLIRLLEISEKLIQASQTGQIPSYVGQGAQDLGLYYLAEGVICILPVFFSILLYEKTKLSVGRSADTSKYTANQQ